MKVIGITGGVGAGKSEILSYLMEHCNCRILMADRLAEELEQPGQICYDQLLALLGREILQEDGRIDRKKMAARIFTALPPPKIPLVRQFTQQKRSLLWMRPFSIRCILLTAAMTPSARTHGCICQKHAWRPLGKSATMTRTGYSRFGLTLATPIPA